MKKRLEILPTGSWRAAEVIGQCRGLRKEGPVDVAPTEDGAALNFVMSTASVDRYGDVILQEGWQLDAFKKNPVMLWGHDYSTPPVGKVGNVVIEDGALKAKGVIFQARDVFQFGWSVGEMFRRGFLKAVSVGFAPIEYGPTDKGFEFRSQELLELSAVAVPANPEALLEAKSAGILVPEWRSWSEKVLDTANAREVPEVEAAMAVHKALGGPSVSVSRDVSGDGEEPMPEMVELIAALKENTDAVKALTAAMAADAAEDATEEVGGKSLKTFDADAIARRVISKLKGD